MFIMILSAFLTMGSSRVISLRICWPVYAREWIQTSTTLKIFPSGSQRNRGEHFDLHTGGVDNVFPHHEDEIAQSEGFSGQQFVNYWIHAQHLLADGQKMAKSTGNAYTCAEIEARGFDPLALRYFY